MPTEPTATFHWKEGGFPLHAVSYRLVGIAAPSQGAPAASHHYFAIVPFRVMVRVAGDPEPHTLEYRDAYRFLRDVGRLISCTSCGKDKLIADPFAGQTICDDCGYRAEDRP